MLRCLGEAYPDAHCELDYTTPLDLVVAVILSAQCTDERVNQVTATLFQRYRRPEDYLSVPEEELAADIKPTGFFNQKATAIREASRRIVEAYGGEVPCTMEDLISLRGVARKTANIVLGNSFGIVEGIVGINWWDVTIEGFANHAGTTPMDRRRDALLAAAKFIEAVNGVVTSVPGRQVGVVTAVRAVAAPGQPVEPPPGASHVRPGARLGDQQRGEPVHVGPQQQRRTAAALRRSLMRVQQACSCLKVSLHWRTQLTAAQMQRQEA
jgi:hypothetical protein